MSYPPRVVCAWCHSLISYGVGLLASHGICKVCLALVFHDLR